MSGIRHDPIAPTRLRILVPGESIEAHSHGDHQIIYAGSGVVAVTTDAGTWFAPGTRAIWVPAGCVHALRMLADDVAVTTVAHHCGWASTSAFIDVFRRAFGHTPGSHQRQARLSGDDSA